MTTDSKQTARREYRLPKVFAEDHWDRDCGQTDVVVRETKTHYFVSMDANGYSDMESDADYYVYMGAEIMGLGFLASARATLKALRAAGPPPEATDLDVTVEEVTA